jgi:hypothetical protein
MRRLLALSLLISALSCVCAAGLTAPVALAAGSTTATTTPASTSTSSTAASSASSSAAASSGPGFSLSSATQNAASQSQQPASVPAATTTTSSSGFSGTDALIIAIIAVLVLGGIAFWVWYDSRGQAARVGHGHSDDSLFGQRSHPGSKAARKPRKLKPAERKRRKRGRAR